jgi:hypothetical protein
MPKGQKIRVISPAQDEIIRKCWEHNGYGHHAAKRASQLTGLTESVAHRRAMELGLVFTRERHRWTEPELRTVETHAHLALETIQKKLRPVSPEGVKRTRAAIARQIHYQRFRTNLDGLKHQHLADALGISGERLHQFRTREWIVGKRLESVAQACGFRENVLDEHRHWFYSNNEIVRLLFAARGELNLGKVNQTWFMGLLEPYVAILQAPRKRKYVRRKRSRKPRLGRPKLSKPKIKKPHFSATRPRKPGILPDAVVDAIRAGRRVLKRHGGRRAGDPGSPHLATAIGKS